MQTKHLRIGTRGSALALWQANAVRSALVNAAGIDAARIEIVPVTTSGDRMRDRALSEVGGKGLFSREIEERLCEGSLDLAVHSAKDLETRLGDGLVIAGHLPRADVRDAFVSNLAADPEGLPEGATIGTASLRRRALVRRLRPDLNVVLLRGNVPTRLERAERGDFSGTLLALAGLQRLGLADRATSILDTDRFPPACGQGAIAIECRGDNARARDLAAAVDHADTSAAIACERAFLAALDGSCRSPIAGLATVVSGMLSFAGLLLSPNGDHWYAETGAGPVSEAEKIGRGAGAALRRAAPHGFLEDIGIA